MQDLHPTDIFDRRSDLNGMAIKFVLSRVEKDTPLILDFMQQRLNFTFQKVDFEGYGTLLSNGSWLGTIKQLLKNEIDFAPLKLDLTQQRMEVVKPGYVSGQTVNYLIFNRKFQGSSLPWYTILQVFDKAVYILLTVIILVLSLFLALMSINEGFLSQYLLAFVSSVKAILGQSFGDEMLLEKPKFKLSKSIQIFSISILGAFVFWCFSGVLISLLTVPSVNVPLKSLDDLDGSPNKLYTYSAGSTASYIYKWSDSSAKRKKIFNKHINMFDDWTAPVNEAILKEMIAKEGIFILITSESLPAIYEDIAKSKSTNSVYYCNRVHA